MKKMTILVHMDNSNALQLRQIQNVFAKVPNCSVICKPSLLSAIDYLANNAVHTIIASGAIEQILCDNSMSEIPIVFFGDTRPGFPTLQVPFTQLQATQIINRYTKPYYKMQQLQNQNKKIEKENHALQQIVNENEKYLRKAAQLQSGLLKTVQYDDLPVFSKSRPVRKLGGDFYYYKRFENQLFFCIGDVVDHGADAAIYMTELLAFFISLLQTKPNLLALIKEFNRLCYEYNNGHMTATVIIGCLDINTGKLEFCNQGHEPPICVGEKTCELTTEQIFLPVGIEKTQEFEITTVYLNEYDKLFLYTDGLIEEFNNCGVNMESAYGLDRLLRILEKKKTEPIATIGAAALGDMDNYIAGSSQNDDVTILIFGGRKKQCKKNIQ